MRPPKSYDGLEKEPIELPVGKVERHPHDDDDDEWGVCTEWPRRIPPRSPDFNPDHRRSKNAHRRPRRVSRRLDDSFQAPHLGG